MNKLFVSLALFLTLISNPVMAAGPIGTLGTIPALTVGGRLHTDVAYASLITLVGRGTNANRSAMRKIGASASYLPSGSKDFYATSAICWMDNATAATVAIGYGTTDVGWNSSASNGTPIWLGGSGNESTSGIPCGVSDVPQQIPLQGFKVPNGSYVFTGLASAGITYNVIMFGYEL